jgi:hypothetical protein
MDWDLLLRLVIGFVYGHYGYRFYSTARRRVEFRSGHELNRLLAVLWALLWPVWAVMWIATAIVFQQRPASLLREPSKADRAAAERDRRAEERSAAIQDWQARASHWYALGQKAEAEEDQALKWTVAANLDFLLATKPDGAQVKGLTKPEKVSVDDETGEQTIEVDWSEVAKSIEKKAAAHFGIPSAQLAKRQDREISVDEMFAGPRAMHVGGHAVEFCSVCYCYRESEQMTMKGMCNECAVEQGF